MAEPQDTLWTRTARSGFAPDEAVPAAVEVAIVGGGFTGLTAARELVMTGRTVAVLEAGRIGAGASGANAGFVVPNFARSDPVATRARLGQERGDALLRLVGDGADAVFGTIDEEAIACDAGRTGWLNPAVGPAAAGMLAERAAMWQALGRPVSFLSAGEIREQTGMAIYSGGLLDAAGGVVHPLDYLRGLARAVQRRGGTVHEGQAVDAVVPDGAGWRLATRVGAAIRAKRVLLCTNAFTTGIAARMGRGVVPLRVYQIATAPVDAATVGRIAPRRRPVGDTRQDLFTYRLDRDDRLVSGGMAAVPFGAEARLGRTVAARLAAELALDPPPAAEVVWSGTAAVTPDFLPRIHQFGEGWFGGIGCNGRGIAMTAQLGRVLARAALGEDPARLPVPLAPVRALPLHGLSPLAVSVALLRARLRDRVGG